MPKPGMHSGVETDEGLNLAMSAKAQPLYNAVKKFIAEEVEPATEEFYALGEGRADRWSYAPGQLEIDGLALPDMPPCSALILEIGGG